MDIWYGIFYRILDMGMVGCIAILAVLAIRALIRKAPKKYAYLLWGIVLFRLLCPVSVPSGLSVLNLARQAEESKEAYGGRQSVPTDSGGGVAQPETGNGNLSVQLEGRETGKGKELLQHEAGVAENGKELLQHEAGVAENGKELLRPGAGVAENGKELLQPGAGVAGNGKVPLQPQEGVKEDGKEFVHPAKGTGELSTGVSLLAEGKENALSLTGEQGQAGRAVLEVPASVAFAIWLAGVGVMACSGLASGIRIRRKAACSMQLWGNVYLADHIASPFVLGLVRPRIYLPAGLGEQEQKYIVLHEQHHISRRDYQVKVLAFAALCLHWFNPLVWLSFSLAGKDMEMSCDEAVLQSLGDGIRAEYAECLLHFTVGKKRMAGMPLAFGEGNAKSRIQNIMYKKKPAAGIIGAVACLIGIACLATDQKPAEIAQSDTKMGAHGLFADISGKKSVDGRGASTSKGQENNGQISASEEPESNAQISASEEPESNGQVAAGKGQDGSGQSIAFGTKGGDRPSAAFKGREEMGEEAAVNWAIRDAIIEQNGSFYSGAYGYDFACCSFVNLKTASYVPAGGGKQKTTYYGWAYYSEYNFTENGIEEVRGSHAPVALTFEVDGEEYVLEKYWEPRKGSGFAQDVRRKFPADIAEEGLDSQKYVLQQVQDCYAQAVEYGRMNTDAVLEHLLEAVSSGTPSSSSDPQAYIDAHDVEYRELLYYGDYTVRYFLKRFQQGEDALGSKTEDSKGQPVKKRGGETGLQGHIMARACEEILGLKKVLPIPAGTAPTGQEWYSGLKAYGKNIVEFYEKMEAENPYTEIGIPVVLPQNRSWIQDIEREELDKDYLQMKYYDSVLEGQCRLWVVKDGDASMQDMIEESLGSKWGRHPSEASLQSMIPEGSPEELWTGVTKSGKSVPVRVQHSEGWVLVTWKYRDYAFAVLGEKGSNPRMIDSLPKTALGIIAELE